MWFNVISVASAARNETNLIGASCFVAAPVLHALACNGSIIISCSIFLMVYFLPL